MSYGFVSIRETHPPLPSYRIALFTILQVAIPHIP